MSQLTCQKCGHVLHATDVDFDNLRASCRHCGWQLGGANRGVYREGHVEKAEPVPEPDEGKALVKKATLPMLPDHVTVHRDDTGIEHLEVEVRPVKTWRVWVLAVLFAGQISISAFAQGELMWWMVAGWVALVWFLGVMMGNVQTVAVRRGELSASYWPFPRPTKRIDVVRLDQLWVEEHVNSKGYVTFRLHARIKGGRDVCLLAGMEDPTGALYLEQRIEELLGITDRAILGEMKTHTRV